MLMSNVIAPEYLITYKLVLFLFNRNCVQNKLKNNNSFNRRFLIYLFLTTFSGICFISILTHSPLEILPKNLFWS